MTISSDTGTRKSRVRASVVCIHDQKILVFKGIDPTSKRVYWFLPGGGIESGETPWECGERETLEETGYRVQADCDSELIRTYAHEWDGRVYDCKTYFYRAKLAEPWHEPRPIVDASYNKGAMWLPLSEAVSAFGYTPEILDAVTQLSRATV